MKDLISREDAIRLITGYNGVMDKSVAKRLLIQMPSAQPEREKGKWIVYYECPKCGEITKDFTEYCPFCNADMRGKEDE